MPTAMRRWPRTNPIGLISHPAPRPLVKQHVAVEEAPAEAVIPSRVPVVAIGASAGGLDAFRADVPGGHESGWAALVAASRC